MKNKPLYIASLLLLACSTQAQAEQVSVNVSATINNVYDPYGVVSDIMPGNSVSGTYNYETTTYDVDASPSMGHYPHASNTGSIDLTTGSYRFKTNANSQMPLDINIDDESWNPGYENYFVISMDNEATNGATIQDISINLWDSSVTSNALTSDALLPTPPSPALFSDGKSLFISGFKNGYSFNIEAQINDLNTQSSGTGGAYSTQYTYAIVAQVDYVNDITQSLNGRLQQGDFITASYTIDSTTVGMPSQYDPMYETAYNHAPGTGSTSVTFGDITLETQASVATPEALVRNGEPWDFDHFIIRGKQLQSADPNFTAERMEIFFGGNGDALSSSDMPTDNNNMAMWQDGFITVQQSEIYPNWTFTARIVSIELVPSQVLQIVPGDAYIPPTMRFDAAFNLTNSAPIIGVSGTLSGQDITPYLQSCQILPPMDNKQSVICPDAHMMLMPGSNTLSVDVMTEDGSSLSNSATWTTN